MKWVPEFSIILILLAACSAPRTDSPQPDMPNPASAYCVEHGYRSEIRTAADGSQSGICIFPDGSECDEWAFFRGECGPASDAVDTTQANIPNPAAAYCVEQGFTSEIRTAADGSQSGVCIFLDGGECDEWAYFRGECGPIPQLTETPGSTASVYAPELVTPDPSLYAGWMTYIASGYGLSLHYPPEWTAELDLRSDSTTYQHLLWLYAPSKPVEGVQLNIAFERIDENFGLQRTGIGAGELIDRGKVLFLGEETPRIVLSRGGADMEVMYGYTGAFERDTMRFAISLYYAGTEQIGLTHEIEQIADLIVASFTLEK
jgi:putative hemolysin